MKEPLRILLADDHAVLRAGLRALIAAQPDLAVVEEAADGPEAVRKARATRPDLVVLDLAMPRTDPLATTRELTRLGARVVVLTMHDDRAYIDAALAAGADGFVVKRAADTELLAAIRAVSRGRQFIDATSRPTDRRASAVRQRLSPRENVVLRGIAEGHTNREIAGRLEVSIKTVETFRARACQKLGLRTRAELVGYALRMGLLGRDDGGESVLRRPSPPRRA